MTAEIASAPSMAWPGLQKAADAIDGWFDRERDQLVLWLPVGLGCGIAAWFALPGEAAWIAFLLTMAGLAGLMALAPAGRWIGRAGPVFALLAAGGCALIWARAEWVAAPVLARPGMVRFAGTVTAVQPMPARDMVRVVLKNPVRHSGESRNPCQRYRSASNATVPPSWIPAFAGMTGKACDRPLPPRIRINIAETAVSAGLAPGARIALSAYLLPPAPPAVPGAYDFARVAWFQGIGATGRAVGPVTIVRPASAGWRETLAGLRARLSAHVQSRIAGYGEGGIAAALATGDQGAIPEEDAEALRRSGLAHLLSVSGLHVTAVVGGTMLMVLRLLALSPALALRLPLPLIAAGAAALAGVGYTLLTGAEVPTIRSCIAALLVLLGLALGRDAITLRLVAAGALIVMLLWPEAVAGASFQLSFAAVTAIVALHEHPRIGALLARREEGLAARGGRILLGLLLTGLAVEAALMPIALFHFHKAGFYGAAANIVAIPLTTFVIMPLEALALLFDWVGAGAPFWWLTERALALLLWVAHTVSATPGAVAALPSMPRGAFALMIAGGLWIALCRTKVRRIGLVPLLAGAIWALATPPPDLIVTGDGRHLAIRSGEGLALLRPKAGDYARDVLGEAAGVEAEACAIADLPTARCSRDLCVAVVEGRRILATRSRDFVEIGAMNAACAAADIVISDRRLPRTCRPRWLKADRTLLAETGGLAISLADGRVTSVAAQAGGHPWAR
jgi:competence protein ComEC